ncbi:MAG TPA: diguanylate cyclase [Thermoleophilaceae bacterium]|nr:diguanylate cyclase [Thermoleophilaceae bacterium]
MPRLREALSNSRAAARAAVAGISLAVLALGALAVLSALVNQNSAAGLSQAGVQTSGHMRAAQSVTSIDTITDGLEDRITQGELRRLRRAQRVLDASLEQMEHGSVAESRRDAREAKPIVRRMKPAIERFLATPSRGATEGASGVEDAMEDIIEELQLRLNDLEADPSLILTTELERVTATERAVRTAAFLIVPLGLLCAVVCAWMLGVYRRRSESTMRAAIEMSSREARTDQLTGLANRRALLEELDERIAGGHGFVLAIADLNGFKRYNDTYGHSAGDALLRRLGRKLERAFAGRAIAARLGGDEFCVLLPKGAPASEVERAVCESLSEEGEGFSVSAACGLVTVPDDAGDASGALRVADTRMYASKTGSRRANEWLMARALGRMLDERHPGLGRHVDEVAALATACAEELGLNDEEVGLVRQAGELHDIGKVAIPESILMKSGPPTPDEWEFLRRHTIIGERILAAAPSMEAVGAIVRSSHERWDGDGYPDGLAGEEISIGARIVSVADAFCAMTEDRPYAEARSIPDAVAELRRCSGTQFDPAVVEAFLRTLSRRGQTPKLAVA